MPAPTDRLAGERIWIYPCLALTLGLGLVAASPLGPAPLPGAPDLTLPLVGWLCFGIVFLLAWAAARLAWFAAHREPRPAQRFAEDLAVLGRKAPVLTAGIGLASLDLYFFMWLKPQIAALRPFWADTTLANIGHAIFGQDPWRYLTFMLNEPVGWLYTPVWFTVVVASVYWLILQAPTERRARLLLTYFMLWSVFGPLGQFLLSSAGPIFYQRVTGLPRYAELVARLPSITRMSADYLWSGYVHGKLAYGAGISAMPSLHVATVAWGVLVFRREGFLLQALSWLFGVFIMVASVALGWHYSLDGFVALAGTAACYAIAGHWTRLWQRSRAPAVGMASVELTMPAEAAQDA